MILTQEERTELYSQAYADGPKENPTAGLIDRYTDLVELAVSMRLSGAEAAVKGQPQFEMSDDDNVILFNPRRIH